MDRNIQRKTEWETQIKTGTLTHTMSDTIVGDCYTPSDTKMEKEIRNKRRTYTRNIYIYIYRNYTLAERTSSYTCKLPILRQRKRKRDKHGSRDVPRLVQLVTIYLEKDKNIKRKREWETRIKRRTITPTMRNNIPGDCLFIYIYIIDNISGFSKTERETKRRTYTRAKADQQTYIYTNNQSHNLYPNSNRNLQRNTERNSDQETYIYTYNEW